MRFAEYASAGEAMHGRNPRRPMFPESWGEPPTPCDSPSRRSWIAEHARRDGTAAGTAQTALAFLALRAADPAERRERAAAETRARLRREELALLLLPAHLRRCR